MPSASRSNVVVNVSESQLIKLIKSVTSLVLKNKKKVTAIVWVFYEKRRLQIRHLQKMSTLKFNLDNFLSSSS